MKRIGMALAMATFFTLLIGTNIAFAGRIADRQIRQQERIHQGIRSGELTWGEVRCLEREQLKIQNHKLKAWCDGWLTPNERILLKREQNRASGNIYWLKHNSIDR